MLATLGGFLALLLGLGLLLLPLLFSELSRPRDSAWGALVLLLGLVLVTSADRLTGAPMLAVLCGGLLIGRLGSEVAQARWRALTDEERHLLRSAERWSRSLHQLGAVAASLLQGAVAVFAALSAWIAERRQVRPRGKRWVRAESESGGSAAPVEAPEQQPPGPQAVASGAEPEAVPGAPADPAASPLEAAGEGGDRGPDPAAEAAASEAAAHPGPDPMAAAGAPLAALAVGDAPADPAAAEPGSAAADVLLVEDFGAIDALLDQAAADSDAAAAEGSDRAPDPVAREPRDPDAAGEQAASE